MLLIVYYPARNPATVDLSNRLTFQVAISILFLSSHLYVFFVYYRVTTVMHYRKIAILIAAMQSIR